MKTIAILVALSLVTLSGVAHAQSIPRDDGALTIEFEADPIQPRPGEIDLNINFVNPVNSETQVHIDYSVTVSLQGTTYAAVEQSHTAEGIVSIPVTLPDEGDYDIAIATNGIYFQPITEQTVTFQLPVYQDAWQPEDDPQPTVTGGCLIATAAYGTEMSPQVQYLREIRDNIVMRTESGSAFMSAFNSIYYAFSPTVADLERQNPYVKEGVRIAISPMLATLGLLDRVNGESDMLGYGISVIALNLAIYIGTPALAIVGIRRVIA